MRRAFDIACAAIVLTMSSPLLMTIAAIVRLTSSGGVIYRARRIGRYGTQFTMFKFRTMVANADCIGPPITCRNDPRVTRVGRWLRKTKLDELPELWNVIRGDMGLVGPRPENRDAVARYSASQLALLDERPGITSPATIKYRHEESVLEGADLDARYMLLLQDKLALDLDYIRTRSFLSDVRILLQTAAALIR